MKDAAAGLKKISDAGKEKAKQEKAKATAGADE